MWTFWIALAAMVIALLGILVPIIPDIVLIWSVILVYAVSERFTTIDPLTFVVLTLLAVLGVSAEFWMSQAGAKAGGASIWSILAAIALGIAGAALGLIFFGIGAVPGAFIGALVGLVLAEWYQNRDWHKTRKVVGGWLLGYLLSVGVQLSIGILMILIFVWQTLRG
ncbi:MAG: DUF456 domain-containing protein [Anaerolineae bacterium]|jgi:hypothetical protein